MFQQQHGSSVVVGVDRRDNDHAVLGAALVQVRHTGQRLRVVHAIEPGTAPALTGRAEREAHRQSVEDDLRRRTEKLFAEQEASADVEYEVSRGDPATVLLGAARSAGMIVIGTHGTEHRPPFLLGTVSQDVAVHATCPVLLVPTA